MAAFSQLFPVVSPLIGVVHLPPLPGYPRSPGIQALIAHALADLRRLEAAGYDAVLLENEHDQPHQVTALPETLAVMTRIAAEVVRAARTAIIGVEILLNDPRASLAAAHAAGGRFIRTDYFVDRMTRPEYGGEMAIDPDGLTQMRRRIGADQVLIFADVQVKYATMIEPRPLADSARLAAAKGADAVVVSGERTGAAPDAGSLASVRAALGAHPVLIGSGLTAENAPLLLSHATGAIVGTGIMTPGAFGGVIDPARAAKLAVQRR